MKRKKFAFPWERRLSFTKVPSVESEFVKMSDRLITETLGDEGVVTAEFSQYSGIYNAEENPISPEDARKLLVSMVKQAVDQRKKLVGKFVACVESGDLYRYYYDDFRKVNDLAIQAAEKQRIAETVYDDYLFEKEAYRRNRLQAYVVRAMTGGHNPDQMENTDSPNGFDNGGDL